jgi:DNA-binding Xre family transcriptional regulator
MYCKLGQIMTDRNLTQAGLSKETGLSATTIRNLANNRFDRVDNKTIDTLCTYLELGTISDLLVLDAEKVSILDN